MQFPKKNVALRPYQRNCVDAILASPAQRKLAVLPTGAGKTFVVVALQHTLKAKTLFIAHRRELISQTVNAFQNYDAETSVGVVMADQNELGNDVTVASIQTLANPNRLLQLDTDYNLIVVDEAHHIYARSYRHLLYRYGLCDKITASMDGKDVSASLTPLLSEKRTLLGITATPIRSNKDESLNDVFDEKVFSLAITDLIPDYLCDFRCITVQTQLDMSNVSVSNGDLSASGVDEVFQATEFFDLLPDIISEHIPDRKRVLVFVSTVDGVHSVMSILQNAGIPCGFVIGDMKKDDRRETLDKFKTGEIQVMVNCMVLTEGYDCPEVDAIVVLRPTKSALLLQQMIGRGLRTAEGKDDCVILDLAVERRQKDLISVAGSGIFGGFQDLVLEHPGASLMELIAIRETEQIAEQEQRERAEREAKATDERFALNPTHFIDSRITTGVMEVCNTAWLRWFVGNVSNEDLDVAHLWKILGSHLARVSSHYRSMPATDKQCSYLENVFGLRDTYKLNRGDAWALIGTFKSFERPTAKQIRYLSRLGVPDTVMPKNKTEASELIQELQHKKIRQRPRSSASGGSYVNA